MTMSIEQSRNKDLLSITAVTIAVKLILLVFAGQVFQVLTNKRLTDVADWFAIWIRWDTLHYLRLAEHGYSIEGTQRASAVFYPLYPLLIRGLSYITHDYFGSALIISTFASVVAMLLFYELLKIDEDRETSLRGCWLFLIFPTAYFLHIGYTESLFLMFVFGSFLSARKGLWMWAGILGMLACMTRANGLVLAVALGIEVLHQIKSERKWRFEYLWVCLVPVGFLVYLGVIYNAAGDAFAFLPIRKEAFSITLGAPWQGIYSVFNSIWQGGGAEAEMVGIQELLFLSIGFVCLVISWFKLRPSYSTFITLSWLLIVSVNFIASSPRYTLTMFPIFILMARLTKDQIIFAAITVWSLLFYGFFVGQFVFHKWAF